MKSAARQITMMMNPAPASSGKSLLLAASVSVVAHVDEMLSHQQFPGARRIGRTPALALLPFVDPHAQREVPYPSERPEERPLEHPHPAPD